MWRNINEGYEICSTGEIRNRKTQRILKPWKQGNYLGVWLGAGNKGVIHKLVAEFFLPSPTDENCVIDHIDRNTYNNNAENLRWCSRRDNALNRTIELKCRPNSKLKEHHISINPQGKYIVRIVINEKLLYSYHSTIEEAINWRDEKLK